jgi:hypothetical protein
MALADDFNDSRYRPGTRAGFYESYFVRANHPARALAFWIRYTVFCPRGRPDDAIGELWAVCFDGETRRHVVAKTEVPAGHFSLSPKQLHVRVGNATLEPGRLQGGASHGGHHIEWDLEFGGDARPLFLLDTGLYDSGFPRAKSLVSLPLARFRGTLRVDGQAVAVDDWDGSLNHNWGTRHTDRYAWGQVAGFDNAPDSFLEVATAQLRLGPLWSPPLTPLVLRHRGDEHALRSIGRVLRAHGHFNYFHWTFRSQGPGVAIEGEISAPREAFVGLRYYNPPGGQKWCLNTKIAGCRLRLARDGRPVETLQTVHRAAFEILTDDLAHGIDIRT